MGESDAATKTFVHDTLKAGGTVQDMTGKLQSGIKGFGGLSSAVTSFGKALSGAFLNAGIMLVVSLLIEKFMELVDTLVVTQQEALDKAKESRDELQSIRNELNSVQSELEETRDRIDDIQSLGTLSFTEKAELENLERQNELLEAQEERLKTKAKLQEQIAARDARSVVADDYISTSDWWKAALDTLNPSNWFKNTEERRSEGQFVGSSGNLLEQAYQAQKALNEARLEYNELIKEGATDKELEKQDELIGKLQEKTDECYSNLYDQLYALVDENGNVTEGYEDLYNSLTAFFDFSAIDVTDSPLNQELAKIQRYFDGSSSRNAIATHLKEIAKNGGSASEEMRKLGLSIEGVKDADLDDYFKEIAGSVEDLTEATSKYAGTLESVTKAFDSADAGANWSTVAGYLDDIKEAFDNGQIGTDQFESFVEFANPLDISNDKNLSQFKHNTEAYYQAYKDMLDKMNRYFDTEDPLGSVNVYLDDLKNSALITITDSGDGFRDVDFAETFTTSKQAADALGMSIEATEVLLHNLSDYGIDFGENFQWSGEQLDTFKNDLELLRQKYQELKDTSDSDYVTNLGNMLDDWDKAYEDAQYDLDTLTQDQIIEIEFQYNLASLQQATDAAALSWSANNNAETGIADILAMQDEISALKEKLESDGIEIPVELEEPDFDALKTKLDAATSDDEKISILADFIADEESFMNILRHAEQTGYVDITVGANTNPLNEEVDNSINETNNKYANINVYGNADPLVQTASGATEYVGSMYANVAIGADTSKFDSAFSAIRNKLSALSGISSSLGNVISNAIGKAGIGGSSSNKASSSGGSSLIGSSGGGTVKKGYIKPGTYTIIEEANGKGASKWGKLKSGAGWISLDFAKRI